MDQSSSGLNGSTYKGSFIFSPIASMAGLPIDQFNFLLSEVLALIFGILFRRLLPPKPSNTFSRHIVGRERSFVFLGKYNFIVVVFFAASFLGIALSYFCFGFEIWHLIAQSSTVYLMLAFLPGKYSHLVAFVFCMAYMSASEFSIDRNGQQICPSRRFVFC